MSVISRLRRHVGTAVDGSARMRSEHYPSVITCAMADRVQRFGRFAGREVMDVHFIFPVEVCSAPSREQQNPLRPTPSSQFLRGETAMVHGPELIASKLVRAGRCAVEIRRGSCLRGDRCCRPGPCRPPPGVDRRAECWDRTADRMPAAWVRVHHAFRSHRAAGRMIPR
jgi:hypothetical protein